MAPEVILAMETYVLMLRNFHFHSRRHNDPGLIFNVDGVSQSHWEKGTG